MCDSLCIVNNTGSQFPATWFHKTPISLITCGGIRKHWLQKLTYKQSQACSILIKSDQASNKIQLQLTFVSLSSTFNYRISKIPLRLCHFANVLLKIFKMAPCPSPSLANTDYIISVYIFQFTSLTVAQKNVCKVHFLCTCIGVSTSHSCMLNVEPGLASELFVTSHAMLLGPPLKNLIFSEYIENVQ